DAAKRTSIGKEMDQPDASMRLRTARSTSGTRSAGTAYSISAKRTVRFVVNTRCEASVNVRFPVSLSASRLTVGITTGTADPSRHVARYSPFDTTVSSTQRLRGDSGRRAAPDGIRVFVFV